VCAHSSQPHYEDSPPHYNCKIAREAGKASSVGTVRPSFFRTAQPLPFATFRSSVWTLSTEVPASGFIASFSRRGRAGRYSSTNTKPSRPSIPLTEVVTSSKSGAEVWRERETIQRASKAIQTTGMISGTRVLPPICRATANRVGGTTPSPLALLGYLTYP